MPENYPYFKKKAVGKEIFVPHRRNNRVHVFQKYLSNYVYLKDMYQNLKEIGIIQAVSKLAIFVNLWVCKLRSPH